MAILNVHCAIALLVTTFLLPPKLPAADDGAQAADVYALMAVYVQNFAKFTTWPVASFTDPAAALNLCILGEDPFGMALTKVDGSKIRSHPLRIKHYPRVAVLSGCHIVFVSRSEQWRLAQILHDLAAAPILTVSDIPDFSRQGGMITLSTVDRRLRFAINPAAVARAGLMLSSKLLELAQIVGSD
ncbi:MAG: YfiR family protein [Candidatus Competibacteraceae bacterium]|nr:YfiR family protein [Candidatus Competibacteraceae bacterium]